MPWWWILAPALLGLATVSWSVTGADPEPVPVPADWQPDPLGALELVTAGPADRESRTAVAMQPLDSPGPQTPTRTRAQVARHRAFLDQEKRLPGSLARDAAGYLAGAAPREEKAALVLALADPATVGGALALAGVVSAGDPGANEHSESLPRLALRELVQRAPKDAASREQLVELAFDPRVEASLRRQAVAHAAALASTAQLFVLLSRLATHGDNELALAALEALDAGAEPAVRDALAAMARGDR